MCVRVPTCPAKVTRWRRLSAARPENTQNIDLGAAEQISGHFISPCPCSVDFSLLFHGFPRFFSVSSIFVPCFAWCQRIERSGHALVFEYTNGAPEEVNPETWGFCVLFQQGVLVGSSSSTQSDAYQRKTRSSMASDLLEATCTS